jgi:RHS repeat-associated protein
MPHRYGYWFLCLLLLAGKPLAGWSQACPALTLAPLQVATTQAGRPVSLRAVARQAGAALTFDGVDDAVTSADVLANVTNTFTVEAWVNPVAPHELDYETAGGVTGLNNQRYLIFPTYGDSQFGAGHAGMGISVGTNGVSVYEHAAGYMPPLLVWAGSLSGWTHIAVVYRNRQPFLYVNGTLVKTGLQSTIPYVHPSLGVGGGAYGYYQGQVDELRIWRTDRTNELQQYSTRPVAAASADLVTYWRLDEGSGSTVTDASGGGHQGTLERGVYVVNGDWNNPTPPPTPTGPQWVGVSPVSLADDVTYSWSPATGLNQTTGASVSASPATTTTYTVTAVSTCGRQATTQTTVRITAAPVLPPDNPAANPERNWTLEKSFDGEGNTVAESKQFTDGLGRPTQAQARNAATRQVFAAQTIYNTGGQAVLQTMAAPTNNQSFNYKDNFVTAAGTPYGPANFEDGKANAPDAVDATTPGTLGYYYSQGNTAEPLTPATSYPYSLTEPYDGPMGGTRRAAGPGDALRMGSGREGKGRDFLVRREFDDYLRRRPQFVPGSPAASLEYQAVKSVSVNADGRESIVVSSKDGQTLISCLSGPQYTGVDVYGYISSQPANPFDSNAPVYQDVHIPAAGPQDVKFTMKASYTAGGRVLVRNLLTDDTTSYAIRATSPGGEPERHITLNPGFYRFTSVTGAQWSFYRARYGDFSYTYYDDAGRVIATVAPKELVPTTPVVKLKNADFELFNTSTTTRAEFWQTDGNAQTLYTDSYGGGHSGLYHGTHYNSTGFNPFYALTHQTLTNLPNGRYTLRAWVKGTGNGITSRMLARNFGGALLSASVPYTAGNEFGVWTLLEIPDILVTNGQCDVGFESNVGSVYYFMYFDDVELVWQDYPVPPFVTRNTYDTSGRLLATESNDEGRSEYVYAKDGRIRFSQSALQRPAGRFSYSNYDEVGRVVESGEYTPGAAPAAGTPLAAQRIAAGFQSTPYSSDDAATNGTKVAGCCIAYLNSLGNYVQFTVQVPSAGTYVLRYRYAAGQPGRQMTLLVNGAVVGPAQFAQTDNGQWGVYQAQEFTAALQAGTNTIQLECRAGDTGGMNISSLQVAEQPMTTVSLADVLEERMPANSLKLTNCAQRNQVWYDLAWDGTLRKPDGTPDTDHQDSQLTGRTQEFTVGAVAKTKNDNVTTWYSYDELGRVTWVVQNIAGMGVKTLDYRYDFSGNVLEVAYQKGRPDSFYHYYDYDAAQRLTAVYASPDGAARTLQAEYSYYLHGPLKRVQVAGDLQGVDYVYTLQGALKSINHATSALEPGHDAPRTNGVYKDLFALTLEYFSGDYRSGAINVTPPALPGASGTSRYDGTIQAAAWRTGASPDIQRMAYTYDEKSQLQNSTYSNWKLTGSMHQLNAALNTAFQEGGMSYDANGNILSLRRTNQTGAVTDDFTYKYKDNTNQLKEVHSGSAAAATLDYDYDELGQMTRQRDEQGQRYFTYDVTGKTTGVYTDAAHTQPVVTFAYDDRGFRVSKTAYAGGAATQSTYYVRDVAGNILTVYNQPAPAAAVQRAEVPLYGASRLGSLTHLSDGTAAGLDDYRYELSDHLGDARVVFHRPTTEVTVETMELAGVPAKAAFLNDDRYRVAVSGAPSGDYVARLTDSQPEGQELKKVLHVSKGDTITFSALAQWKPNATSGGNSATPYVLAGAAAGLAPLSQRGAEGPATAYATNSPNWLSLLAGGLGFTLGGGNQAASLGNTSLTGWIKYRVLDDNGTEIASGRDYLLGTGQWEYLQTGVRVAQNGTIEVMAGTTGTGEAVYFDNLRVEQTGGLIVQEQHQYAFGAPLPGLSYVVGTKRYRYGYQGQYAEHDEETGFESFELRLYNSRIGRWMSNDPYGQFNSPYVGMGNNPVSGVDPDGGFSGPGPGLAGVPRHAKNVYKAVATTSVAAAKPGFSAVSTAVRVGRIVVPSLSIGYANGAFVGGLYADTPTKREYYADGAKWVFKDLYTFADAIYKGAQIWDISGRRDIAGRPVTQRESASGFYSSLAMTLPGGGEAASAKGTVTVGRWMSLEEYHLMRNTGRVIEGGGGVTFVTVGGPHVFPSAARGSVYAEFSVPANSLRQGGVEGWYKLIGPSAPKSQLTMLRKQGGDLLPVFSGLSPILHIK